MGEVRVWFVDSDDHFAGALSAYLSAEPAIRVVTRPPAEVAVVTGGDSHTMTRALAEEGAVLVVGSGGAASMIGAFESGAMGYLDHRSAFDGVRHAIMAIADGEAVVPSDLLSSLIRHVIQRRRVARADLEKLSRLTGRERDVFNLLARGLDRDAIAKRLFISVGTVRTHLHRVFRKLEIHTHAEVVAMAARCGLAVDDRDGRRE